MRRFMTASSVNACRLGKMKSESAASASDFSAFSRWPHRPWVSHGCLATPANAGAPARPFNYRCRRRRALCRLDPRGCLAALTYLRSGHDTRHTLSGRGRRVDFWGVRFCRPESRAAYARQAIRRLRHTCAAHGGADLDPPLHGNSKAGRSPVRAFYSTEAVASTKSGLATVTSTGAGSIATITTL
jgi:hypothetical protein